jgi:hypothetical protein
MRFRWYGWLVFLIWAHASTGLAQSETWSASVSATPETLWGVCSGPQGFVAVGEKGAIVTSSDGVTWVSRTSGTSVWLLAVTWAQGVYLAVGDNGTLLASSDAVTWQTRTTGTLQRLNAIAFGDGTWVIAGEAGTVLTSPDGLTWTLNTVGEPMWLRGLAHGAGRFVISGQQGRIYVTTDRGRSFTRSYVATSGGLEGVAFDGEQFHVVGDASFLASSSDTMFWRRDSGTVPSQPNTYRAVTSFVGTRLIVGDAAHLGTLAPPRSGATWRAVAANDRRAVAVGVGGAIASVLAQTYRTRTRLSLPEGQVIGAPAIFRSLEDFGPGTQWQWFRNQEPIAGATAREYRIAALTPSMWGTFTVEVTRTDGGPAPDRNGINLPPLPVHFPTQNAVDPTFQVPFTFVPQLIVPANDGSIYVADSDTYFDIGGRIQHGLVRLRPDGSFDPSFNLGSGLDADGAIDQIYLLASGDVAIRGTFQSVNGQASPNFARLKADGRLDAEFQPDPELRDTTWLSVPLRDERWLIIKRMTSAEPAPVVRFDARGRRDAAFTLAMPALLFPDWPLRYHMDQQGGIYLVGTYSYAGNARGGFVTRLQADGLRDPDFLVTGFEVRSLATVPEGIILSTETFSPATVYWSGSGALRKVDSRTGQVEDPAFKAVKWKYGYHNSNYINPEPVPGTTVFRVVPVIADREGGLYGWTGGYEGRMGIVRLNSRGERDPEFSLECVQGGGALFALPNGNLLAYNTSTLNGRPVPGLVRLVPDRTAGKVGLINLSVRARAGSGAQTLIVGYITANGSTSVLARGAGPALGGFGVPDPLADPSLTLFQGATALAQNQDWSIGADPGALASAATRVGAFAFAPGSRDAALLASAPTGAYTLQVTSSDAGSGVALAELYLTSDPPANLQSPRIINFSVRTQVGTGADALIAGFSVAGPNTRKLLIRAIGPSLAPFGVTGTLADPKLTLFRGDLPIGENDQWGSYETPYGAIYEATRVAGAFALAPTSRDAALIANLPPGGYTVRVTGVGDTTGIVLLEVYELP